MGALTALPIAAALKVVFGYLFRDQLSRIDAQHDPYNDERTDEPPDKPTG